MKAILFYIRSTYNYPPMGVLYLSDALKKSGIECHIFPADNVDFRVIEPLLISGETVVGMSTITAPGLKNIIALSKIIKSRYHDIPVIWGGVHASLNGQQCINEQYIDDVFVGHSERAFVDFVSGSNTYKFTDGNIDDYSPDWDQVLPLSQFLFPFRHSAHTTGGNPRARKDIFYYLQTSRGCLYGCSFCSVPLVTNHWHSHSFEWVKNEIDKIQGILKSEGREMGGIGFWDDMFFADMTRANKIISYLKSKDIGYLVEARADHLVKNDYELFKRLSETGCIQIFVGGESLNQETLTYLDKRIRSGQLYRIKRMAEKYKMPVRFSLIVGFPNEGDYSVNDTLDFVDFVNTDSEYCSISGPKLFTPYPGTIEFTRAIARDWKAPANTLEWSTISRQTDDYENVFPWYKENFSEKTLKRIESKIKGE